MSEKSPYIITSEWLSEHLEQDNLSIVDGSWYLPAMGRNALAEYEEAHIPGAVFFDHDKIADHTTGLPHSLPSPEFFAQNVGEMGISSQDMIVVYDGPGFFSAPRLWWMFKIMGAQNVFILDGGLDGWKNENRPLTTEKTVKSAKHFESKFQIEKVVTLQQMRDIVSKNAMQIADARGRGRFTGEQAEPRAGMKSGHMPHARNVPYSTLSKNGKFLSLNELKEQLTLAGIDPSKPVVTTCGSGVTAAVVALALESLGNEAVSLYDGSWSEWGALPDTQVEKGEVQ